MRDPAGFPQKSGKRGVRMVLGLSDHDTACGQRRPALGQPHPAQSGRHCAAQMHEVASRAQIIGTETRTYGRAPATISTWR